MAECCPALALALDRAHDRFGLSRELMMSLSGAAWHELVVRFRRAKRGDTKVYDGHDLSNATYAVVRFCPFCGAKQKRGKAAP